MKKVLLTHFIFFAALFIFTTAFKKWFSLDYLPFWIGGVVGLFLPDLDHILYIYFLKPKEAISQKAAAFIGKREFNKSWEMMATSRGERVGLIFHTAQFHLIFAAFAFLVITSSGSLLGTGLVIAFFLHLSVDQAIDYFETGTLSSWFKKVAFSLTKDQEKWYLLGGVFLLLVFALYL